MEYFAHKTDNSGQTVKAHLEGVAEKSKAYSIRPLKDIAYYIGLAHDIGKYSKAFQDRLNGSKVKYEHSACGALETKKLADKSNIDVVYMLLYCIAGHHTGLPDGDSGRDLPEDNTLQSKLKRAENYNGDSDYSAYKSEVKLQFPDFSDLINKLRSSKDKTDLLERYAFFTRYLFSCLTDADFIDTEEFYYPELPRGLTLDFEKAIISVNNVLEHKTEKSETVLQKARTDLQKQAFDKSSIPTDISILNMPTGSGKTLCSLKIALDKLKRDKSKKHIIYVIPYTSIIEQTAAVFEDIFGEYGDILQHHSNYVYEKNDDQYETEDTEGKMKRAAENWDAPVIITTSVQFFQSLYHCKSSGLRKLHNMADSIIVFDEIHMLPVNVLQPCLRGIGHITRYLNSEAIFLSATMPDYTELFERFLSSHKVSELITDKSNFSCFEKCRYEYIGETSFESVSEKAQEYKSALIIVNSKRSARKLYGILPGEKFHLSTYMTPADRLKCINKIKKCLDNEEKITVVSTSLVEAGVDLDFEVVFREIAGLDSILQSGGRCNREGKRESGDVFIFETDSALKGDIKIRAAIVKDMLKTNDDISSDSCIKEYYKRLFYFSDDEINKNTIANGVICPADIPFRSYYERFKMIETETVSVVINNRDETHKLMAQLPYGGRIVKRGLQKYSVSLRVNEIEKALSLGIIEYDTEKGVYVLADNHYYSDDTGLDTEKSHDVII